MSRSSAIEALLPELRAYAMSIAPTREDAEDLVQDGIERCLNSDTMPTGIEDLRPWMFRVLRNLQYDGHRKTRVRREFFDSQTRLSNELSGSPDTERDVLVRLAFEKLPPDSREVLFLVDILGLKYAEAAKVMGVAIGTVMSRVSRSRRMMAERIRGSARD